MAKLDTMSLAAWHDALSASAAFDSLPAAAGAGTRPQGCAGDPSRPADAGPGQGAGGWSNLGAQLADENAEAQAQSAELLSTQGADVNAGFSPFDRATMERALDGFLDELAGLDAELARLLEANELLPRTLLVGTSLMLGELLRRRLRGGRHQEGRRADDEDEEETGLPGFPGLPRRPEWELV